VPAGVLRRLLDQRDQADDVAGAVSQVGRDDDLVVGVDDGLSVEALLERPAGRHHDPAVGVGEVPLRLGLHHCRLGGGRGPLGDGLVVVALAPGQLRRVLRRGLGGFGFQRGLGLAQLDQPALPASELGREALLDRGLVEVGAAATLPVTGLGNASVSCWSLTLEQLAPRIIEFGLATQDTLDRTQLLLADPRFGDLGHGTLSAWGRQPSS
jgi:hypothetical protein